ncbi:carbohydrate binding family 9 domain-containing protein [candidate division KSB1 bacterium]|nr:carbohydrate binding family 9 domain-containing protein [candidate division KSB1 bacterium]
MTKNKSMFLILLLAVMQASAASSTYKAVRLTEKIVVDGILSEPIWENAPAISGLLQRNPEEGEPATQKTFVRIAYDEDAIYFGVRMLDTAPDSIVSRLSRRDNLSTEDHFALAIDSYHDHRSGFIFGLSAGGTFLDGVCYNDDWSDDTWDGVWDGKVRIDDQGWTTEFCIPFSQLRFKTQDEHIWGINFLRVIARRNEESWLVYTPKGSAGFVSRFPELTGIKGINPSRNVEVLPYTRLKAAYTHPEAEDPFHSKSEYSPDAGADIKIGLSNNLTLDMTINPDFGQVEVDPAVVNLSDIETFYREKRPFFIEGASTYRFGQGGARSYWGFNWSNPNFFYSRRIGRAPQGEEPDNNYADVPDGVHILSAAKVTGKLAGKWNVGTMHALTRKEIGQFSLDSETFKAEMEPLTYYGVFRTQREINDSRQGIGMVATLTKRQFGDQRLRADLNDNALSFGLDGWTFLDTSKTWVFAGWMGGSHIEGTPDRMTALQRSSRHYFQRPDTKNISVDSSATSLSGYAGRFHLNKQRGNVIVNSAVGFISPGFEVNDLGYFYRADVINGHLGTGYLWTQPGKVFRSADVIGAIYQSYDFEGNNIWRGVFLLWECQFLNYMEVNARAFFNPETINKYRTRGGPLTLSPPGMGYDASFETDNRKLWVLDLEVGGYHCSSNEWSSSIGVELEWKPSSNVEVEVGPSIEFIREFAQWVDVFDDPFATRTFGNRYVFAEMEQTEISANIRLDWTFTPKLSLQLYMQPLISTGDYNTFKELDRPNSYDFNLYSGDQIVRSNGEYEIDPDGAGPADSFSFENPDFNYKSLRGNAVLRWEYKPGSTLYLVWTQNRWNDQLDDEFSFRRSFRHLSTAQADNIFMLKATYWWSL